MLANLHYHFIKMSQRIQLICQKVASQFEKPTHFNKGHDSEEAVNRLPQVYIDPNLDNPSVGNKHPSSNFQVASISELMLSWQTSTKWWSTSTWQAHTHSQARGRCAAL